jgi:hypothetical protein
LLRRFEDEDLRTKKTLKMKTFTPRSLKDKKNFMPIGL